MAEAHDDADKTEPPSQKRLDEARRKGQVSVSREVQHWFSFVAGGLVVFGLAPGLMRDVAGLMTRFIEAPHLITVDGGQMSVIFAETLSGMGAAMLPIFGVLVMAAAASGLLQVGFQVSTEQLMPKLERISPASGFKRMFSLRSLADFAKGIAKLAIVGGIAAWLTVPELYRLDRLVTYDMPQLLGATGAVVLRVLIAVVAVMTVLAILDFAYQRYTHLKGLRMSRQELREEYKQSEGDPAIKARLRQIRTERARRRMMAKVPKADVVITNPTHFAVALEYKPRTMTAPRLVAKGQDLVAQRIRKVAEENDVAIVENPPLARALYSGVDLDEEIPPQHYKAVAEVIGYVFRLKRKAMPN